MARAALFVRYVSPFGSPASMPLEDAERYRAQDLDLLALMRDAGAVDERMARIGEPRIGDDRFHLRDLPDWQPGDDFDLVRDLVRSCEQLARNEGESYVVVSRSGRSAVFPRRLLIDGDVVRWASQT